MAASRKASRSVLTPVEGERGRDHAGKAVVAAGPLPAWERLMEHWPGLVYRQRPDLTFEYVSPGIETLTGLPAEAWQKAPSPFWEVVHELDADEVRAQLRRAAQCPQGQHQHYRVRNLESGRLSYLAEYRRAIVNADGKVEGYEGYWLDTSRQAIAEKRLANAAWKETLAVITMGLAHDFNNIIAGISSLSDSFLLQLEADHPFREGLSLINHNAYQASQLIQRIVHLHHGRTGNRGYQDLNGIVSDTAELLRKVIPRRIETSVKPAPQSLALYVDEVELRQVIINLALNAADAMPDRGSLRFETSAHTALPRLKTFKGILPRVPCCCLTVADNGTGIKAGQMEAIFEPFFTTKTLQRGSGLGLYNAKLFAEKHQGAISVESTEGAGTTFKVWLPQADFTEADRAQEVSLRRRRCVLLVGAKGEALDGMAEFLRLHNYQVFAVSHQAEEWLQSDEYYFDAVMVQIQAGDRLGHPVVGFARKHQLPARIILQIVGCNQEELETQFLMKADLVLTPDVAEPLVLEKLRTLFETPREGRA